MTADAIQRRLKDVERLRPALLALAEKHPTPLYVYDAAEVRNSVHTFRAAFEAEKIPMDIYYATKCNPYIGVLKTVTEEGCGIDVSSKREIESALQAGAKSIVFTGPAKSEEEFLSILPHADRCTVNLESLRELRLLSAVFAKAKKTIRCGVRIHSTKQKHWGKFGIPVEELGAFFHEAKTLPGIRFAGIHFHVSHNETPERYVQTIGELGKALPAQLTPEECGALEYLDIGGGYTPDQFEGAYAWNPDQETLLISEGLNIDDILKSKKTPRYVIHAPLPIAEFAKQIGDALRKNIFPLVPGIRIFTEPGRFISHSAMHMLLTLSEKKSDVFGIADGGANMIGWEKYECYTYVPLFNLTNFSADREVPFLLYGSLCTPDDVWGYALRCSDIREGDLLCLPFQGAYTFTLAQNFIREIPPVINLGNL